MPPSPRQPLQFFHRDHGAVETEAVYGESWLRWACENPCGRLATSILVKRACFSRLYGVLMDRPSSRRKILPFLQRYQIDPAEFVKSPEEFHSFNDFFIRKLKPECRPIHPDPASLVFPADGRHLGIPDLSQSDGIFVKGRNFDLDTLLRDPVLARRYREGSLVLSRLCPVDYHRFHFPAAGIPSAPRLLKGTLSSVNPIALRRRIGILTENKRVLTRLKTETAGEILILEIGATNVGSIVQTCTPENPVAKGEEKGYFQFGGSAIITLFAPGAVTLAADLIENSAKHRELYARMGDRLGSVFSAQ